MRNPTAANERTRTAHEFKAKSGKPRIEGSGRASMAIRAQNKVIPNATYRFLSHRRSLMRAILRRGMGA